MKKLILFSIFSIVFTGIIYSQTVSRLEALRVAEELPQKPYFQQNKFKSAQIVNINKIDSIVVDQTTIGYMIYYSPEGFSLIAKVKEITPEFEFSNEGEFSNVTNNSIVDFLLTN